MAIRELTFSGKKDEDVNVFLFKYSLYEMAGKSPEEKDWALISYFENEALNFYLEMFAEGDELKGEGMDYRKFKNVMLSKYSKQKIKAEIIQEAVDLRYSESDVQSFFRDAEKVACRSKIQQNGLEWNCDESN